MPFSGNLTLHKNSFEFEVFKLLPQAGSFEHRVWVVQSKKHTHEISGVFEISYYFFFFGLSKSYLDVRAKL